MASRQHTARSKVLPRLQQQRLPFQNPNQGSSPSRPVSSCSRTVHTRDSTPTSELELNDEVLAEHANDMENPQGPLLTPDAQSQTSESSRKLKRKRTCWVFKHMKDTDDMQKLFFNEDGREIWPCKHCSRKYIIAGGTLNIEKHLWGKHKVFEESPLESKLKNQQLSIQESMASSEANPFKRRKLAQDTFDEKPLDAGTVESLYVKWISTDNKALRLAGCPEFRAFLTYLNANINVCLPSSATSIGEWVLRQFGIEKERIRQRIQSARSKVHISCDLWTAPNSLPILGVVAHYISEDNILESSTLAMVELQGKHQGENIAPIVVRIIEEWGILSKLGFFQMDNAGNNDTMLRAVSQILREDHSIKFDHKLHRIRCQGHIINLAVHSFLFVTDSENLEDYMPASAPVKVGSETRWMRMAIRRLARGSPLYDGNASRRFSASEQATIFDFDSPPETACLYILDC